MKKIGLIMATLLFAMISYGQSVSNTTGINFTFDVNEDLTYVEYTGNAADTISSTDSTWTYTFAVKNLLDDLKVQGRMVLDSVSGVPNTAVYLKGKVFGDDSWTTITTVNWTGSSSDTTFSIDNATAKPYRYLQYAIDCVADSTQKFKVNEFELKLHK